MGSLSPLALRVILAHMDTTGAAAQQGLGKVQTRMVCDTIVACCIECILDMTS